MNDTEELLKECNAGCKTAVNSMEEALSHAQSAELRLTLERYRDRHAALGDDCHRLLSEAGEDGRDPHPIARAMTWFGTEVKLMFNGDDAHVAGLMADGCSMGIKTTGRYKNRYPAASGEARGVADGIIGAEEELLHELLPFF